MALLMNSGAEAVETAIKLARKWAYQVKRIPQDQAEIITFQGNFHGRTTTIISFTTEEAYKRDFGPFTPGFLTLPYGDAEVVSKVISSRTAAILVEPIQGEGGVIIPPDGYLKKLRKLCSEENILLIADEIQTGLGRTGKLFASDHESIRPDVMILGKALAGGFYPVSAVLSDSHILGLFKPGDHGSTFGGNPLGAAVARAALRVITEEGLIENAQTIGEYFNEMLAEVPSPYVHEVRGKGLMIGVELKPNAGNARKFSEALLEKKILVKETRETVLRFAPPLIIDKQIVDWAIERIHAVLTSK
jgi:ornithine--oxo-acid transaminase